MHKPAQTFITHQIRRGNLKPAKTFICTDCPKPARHYDHYLGHEAKHWADVQPVCIGCHRKREYHRHPNAANNNGLHKANCIICPHGIFKVRNCQECKREACKRWREKNKEHDKKRCLRYYYDHKKVS